MTPIVISYVIIIVLQLLFIHFYLNNWRNYLGRNEEGEIKINYNKTHYKKLQQIFKQVVVERMNMLNTMSYQSWIDYNLKNSFIKIDEYEYFIIIYEKVGNNQLTDYNHGNEYITKCYTNGSTENQQYGVDNVNIGLTFEDSIALYEDKYLFSSFKPNPNAINIMYNMSKDENNTAEYSFFRYDPLLKKSVKRNMSVGRFNKDSENYSGIIGIGCDMLDVETTYIDNYYELSDKSFLVLVSLTTLAVSILLYHSSNKKDVVKPIIFLLVTNIYLTYFLGTNEGISSQTREEDKLKDINEGILAISFLVAVNIFILDTLSKTKIAYTLHSESVFLFSISLILLMMSTYKETAANTVMSLRKVRIQKQFMFNLSIFINLFILVNYVLFVGKQNKIF